MTGSAAAAPRQQPTPYAVQLLRALRDISIGGALVGVAVILAFTFLFGMCMLDDDDADVRKHQLKRDIVQTCARAENPGLCAEQLREATK